MPTLSDGLNSVAPIESATHHTADISSDGLQWARENLCNPLVNSAYVDTVNGLGGTVAELVGKSAADWHIDSLPVGDNSNTLNLITQTVAGSVGAIGKFVVAGKLAGIGLRETGAALEVQGRVGSFMRNDSVAQLTGAGALTLAEKPKDGESRLGNFTSTMTTFAAFEGAGALSRQWSASAQHVVRFSVGAANGVGQEAVSDYLAGKEISSDSLMKSALAGGAAGWSLPMLQRLGTRGIDSVNTALGRGITIDRYEAAKTTTSPDQSATYNQLRDANPWVRIQGNSDASYADYKRNMIFLSPEDSTAATFMSRTGHELGHLHSETAAKYEAQFVALGRALGDPQKTAETQSQFIALRTQQEVDQMKIEHSIAKELGKADTAFDENATKASIGSKVAFGNTTYERLWNREFEQFKQSNGAFRPSIEYGGTAAVVDTDYLRQLGTIVAKDLQDSGKIAVFAGGAVRDELLGLKPKDFDIATSATPDQVEQIFGAKGVQVIPKGKQFGVMSVILDGHEFEIATLRQDGDYSDGRRPDDVKFVTSLFEDAARRDLTINAMFKDPVTGQLYDFFNGKNDIANKILRSVGDPDERFAEDRLRMLRVARFKSRYGDFTVAPELIESMTRNAHLVNGTDKYPRVSAERRYTEIKGILTPNGASDGMRLMKDTGLLEQVMPELAPTWGPKGAQDPTYHPEGNVFAHQLMVLDNMAGGTMEEKLAAFIHDIGKPATQKILPSGRITNFGHDAKGADIAGDMMRGLTFSSQEVTDVTEMIRLHMVMHDVDKLTKPKLSRILERPDLMSLVKLQKADALGTTAPDRFAKVREDFILSKLASFKAAPEPAQRLGAPPVMTGDHLTDLGYVPGPAFKMILEAARTSQYEGAITDVEKGRSFVTENFARYQGMNYKQQKELLAKDQADRADRAKLAKADQTQTISTPSQTY